MKKLIGLFLLVIMLLCPAVLGLAASGSKGGQAAAPVAAAQTKPAETKSFAIEDRPVYFLVYDQSGEMTHAIYQGWRLMVKTMYHFPTYKIIDDADQVRAQVRSSFSGNPNKEELARIADQVKAQVLVIAVVHQMSSDTDWGGGWGGGGFAADDWDILVRTVASADLYAYNKSGNKFAFKKVREYDRRELGNEEQPAETIKWALAKMLSKLEGKPEI